MDDVMDLAIQDVAISRPRTCRVKRHVHITCCRVLSLFIDGSIEKASRGTQGRIRGPLTAKNDES